MANSYFYIRHTWVYSKHVDPMHATHGRTEMALATVPAPGTGTTETQHGLDPDGIAAVSDVLGLLVGGRSPAEALQLLASAQGLMDEASLSLRLRHKLITQLHGLYNLLAHGLPDSLRAVPDPQNVLLAEAASLCEELTGQLRKNDPYLHFIVSSLRAECLHLLGRTAEAHRAARDSQVALSHLDPAEGTLVTVFARVAYNTQLLYGDGNPPVTTWAALNELHETIPGA
jgi:hypothetical protein